MEGLQEFDLNPSLDLLRNYADNKDIQNVLESFQEERYSDAVGSIELAKKTLNHGEMMKELLFLELVSYLQMGMRENARRCIQELYPLIAEDDYEKLLFLGELTIQIDLKLARRIVSETANKFEGKDDVSDLIMKKTFLLLAEAEEKLEKLPRAIKYYQRAISCMNEDQAEDLKMLPILYFKLGMLSANLDRNEEAIGYLEKGLELAGDQEEASIHMLAALGAIYGKIEKGKEAAVYLTNALILLADSVLKDTLIHAEVLTELGYISFDLGKINEALPFYEQAIAIYHKDKDHGITNRKLGMIYMQYAYCLEHKEKPNKAQAGMHYENGLRYLEQAGDQELYENAMLDVIAFFNANHNKKKARYYENKILKLANKNGVSPSSR